VGGATVAGSFTISPASETNAGSYPVTMTFLSSDPNYVSNGTANGTLKIDAATPALAVTCTEVTYDGNAHSCTGAATGVGGATVSGSFSFNPASETNVGNYAVTGTFTSTDSNYVSGGTATSTLKIDAGTPALSLTCPEVVYDGNAHVCTGTATGPGGVLIAGVFSFSPASETNAGSYPVTGTFTSADNNYVSGGTANGTLVIDKANQSPNVSCPGPLAYDGNAHACTVTTAIGTSCTSSSVTNVPGGTVNLSCPGDANHNAWSSTGSIVITAIAPTLTIQCGKTIYTPAAQSAQAACVVMATGLNGATVSGSFSFNPPTATNAGSYPVTATFASSNPNYLSGGTTGGTWIIQPAPQTITCVTSIGFSASPVHPCTASSGLPVKYTAALGVVTLTSDGSGLNTLKTGSATISASQSGNQNYLAAPPVTKAALAVVTSQGVIQCPVLPAIANWGDGTYPQSGYAFACTSNSSAALKYQVTGDAKYLQGKLFVTGAGSFTVAVSAGGNTDFAAPQAVQQTVTINKVPLTISAGNITWTYGTWPPSLGTDCSVTGLVNGDLAHPTPKATTSATSTSALGQYPITCAVDDTKPPYSNYSPITYVSGTMDFVINPARIKQTRNSVQFTSTKVGNTAGPVLVTVTNNSGTTVTFTATEAANFPVAAPLVCQAATGSSCTFHVTFTPAQAKTYTGTMTIQPSDAANDPLALMSVSLSGVGR
jgi:hypothetical protein